MNRSNCNTLEARANSEFEALGQAFENALSRGELAAAEHLYYRLQFVHRLRADIAAAEYRLPAR